MEEPLDGTLHISRKGRELRSREITKKQTKEEPKAELPIYKKAGWTPPSEHPWRHGYKPRRRAKDQLPIAI
jgi:hypothetical protein